jgi:hypothetical protein
MGQGDFPGWMPGQGTSSVPDYEWAEAKYRASKILDAGITLDEDLGGTGDD